jgi:hypothetical protein
MAYIPHLSEICLYEAHTSESTLSMDVSDFQFWKFHGNPSPQCSNTPRYPIKTIKKWICLPLNIKTNFRQLYPSSIPSSRLPVIRSIKTRSMTSAFIIKIYFQPCPMLQIKTISHLPSILKNFHHHHTLFFFFLTLIVSHNHKTWHKPLSSRPTFPQKKKTPHNINIS